MCADEVFGGARIQSKELTIAPIVLHLIPLVLVGGDFERHLPPEDRDGLQAFVPGDIRKARATICLDSSRPRPRTPAMS